MNFTWKAEIDEEKEKLCGLAKFMHFHEIKLYNLVQFDYYGDDLFVTKIFKESAIELKYLKCNPKDFLTVVHLSTFKEEEYELDGWSLAYDKARALWNFCACQNYVQYFELMIHNADIDKQVSFGFWMFRQYKSYIVLSCEHILLKVYSIYI